MSNVIDLACYESDGITRLNYLTQWDMGQTVAIDNICQLTDDPTIFFCNRLSNESLRVKASIKDGKIYAKVPNILLQEPLPIVGYVYNHTADDIAKTVMVFRIPIRPCQKPSDYLYVENVDKITADRIENYVKTYLEKIDQSCEEYRQLYIDVQELKKTIDSTVSDAKNATKNANDATSNANSVIQQSKDKISEMNGVISNANQTISDTKIAIQNTVTATDNANKAAENANKSVESITDLQVRVGALENEVVSQNEIDNLFS